MTDRELKSFLERLRISFTGNVRVELDDLPLVLLTTNPTFDAVISPANLSQLTATFDTDSLQKGGGISTLTKLSTGEVIASWDINTSGDVMTSGSVLSIHGLPMLEEGQSYRWDIPQGAVSTPEGRFFDGATVSFTVAIIDLDPPVLESIFYQDGKYVLTFDEPVKSGGPALANITDGSGYNQDFSSVPNSGGAIISGRVVELTPNQDLSGRTLTLTFPSGWLTDIAGKVWGGYSDTINLPTWVSVTPAIGSEVQASVFNAGPGFRVTGSTDLVVGSGTLSWREVGTFGGYGISSNPALPATTTSGNQGTIDHNVNYGGLGSIADLEDATSYEVRMTRGYFRDAQGNDFPEIPYASWQFDTASGDVTGPDPTFTWNNQAAQPSAAGQDLVTISYDENTNAGQAGAGEIQLYNIRAGVVAYTYDLTGDAAATITATSIVLRNPSPLEKGGLFELRATAGYLQDTLGNNSLAINPGDAGFTVGFRTSLAADTPAEGATVSVATTEVVFVASNDLGGTFIETGVATLKRVSDQAIIKTWDASIGTDITKPETNKLALAGIVLAAGQAYELVVPDGFAIDDIFTRVQGLTLTFTTSAADVDPPGGLTYTPANSANVLASVAGGAGFTILAEADENIQPGSGTAVLTRLENSAVIFSRNVATSADVSESSGGVLFDNLPALSPGTYELTAPAGWAQDAAGNPAPAIQAGDYRFVVVADPTCGAVNSFSVSVSSGVATFTFS